MSPLSSPFLSYPPDAPDEWKLYSSHTGGCCPYEFSFVWVILIMVYFYSWISFC